MMVSIGYGNFVRGDSIISIMAPDGMPIRKIQTGDIKMGIPINAAAGRKIQSIIKLSSDHVLLSALLPEILTARLNGQIQFEASETGNHK